MGAWLLGRTSKSSSSALRMCCSVLQSVAVCCSALQCFFCEVSHFDCLIQKLHYILYSGLSPQIV